MARGDFSRRVAATSRDEIGTLARAFNQMAAELAETDRVRRDLVANVSHELRTPITALQAVLENLVDGVEAPDPETLQHDARPGRAAGPARAAAARPVPARVGRRAARSPRVRGRADARARGARAAAARRIGPPLGVGGARDLALDGDPERLHQVVANLVENAVRHSPPDGAVTVSARADAARGARSRSPTKAPASPTPRRHACSSASTAPTPRVPRDHGGAGLGLAIARWIVDLHGGEIHAETREPHGCRMVVDAARARRRELDRQLPSERRIGARCDPTHGEGTLTVPLTPNRRSPAAHPPRRDGARRRRRRPRERRRPHAGRRVGDARGDQLHAALGPRARVHAVRRAAGSTSSRSARWCRPARAGCDTAFTVSIDHRNAGSGIGAADRALDDPPLLDPDVARRPTSCGPGHVFPLRARARRRARTARPHRSRGRPRPPRRPRAGRGDLRGAARRRLAGALPVPRAVRARSTASRWSRSTRSSSTAAQGASASARRRGRPLLLCSSVTGSAAPTGLAVDDLVEVLGEAVAGAAVARPLGHALGDARDELLAFGCRAPVAQRDEVQHPAR